MYCDLELQQITSTRRLSDDDLVYYLYNLEYYHIEVPDFSHSLPQQCPYTNFPIGACWPAGRDREREEGSAIDIIRSSRSLNLSFYSIAHMREKIERPLKGNSAINLYAVMQPNPGLFYS